VNADIVLTQAWMRAVQAAAAWRPQFLMVGRRWDLDVLAPLDFAKPSWANDLIDRARGAGRLATNMYIDYFVFPRGMLLDVPPFVIGRPCYDNWLLWSVRQRGIPLIDATAAAPVIHQNHNYSHIKPARGDQGGHQSYLKGEDTRRNAALAGDWKRFFTTDHATHIVTGTSIRPALSRPYALARVETLRRHLVDISRPIRHRLGFDAKSWARVRDRFR
jgi:hypothetical protein